MSHFNENHLAVWMGIVILRGEQTGMHSDISHSSQPLLKIYLRFLILQKLPHKSHQEDELNTLGVHRPSQTKSRKDFLTQEKFAVKCEMK